jgi:transcriptional regulator with XRE-family HTH domain
MDAVQHSMDKRGVMPRATRTHTPRDLAALLHALRASRGVSLSAVARATGLSTAYVSAIETRKIRNPGCNAVIRLARYYQVPVAQLLGEVDERVSAPLTFEEALEHLRWHASPQSRAAVIAIAQLTAQLPSRRVAVPNGH